MQLTNTILDIVQQASNYKQIRKGANEGMESPCACIEKLKPTRNFQKTDNFYNFYIFKIIQLLKH